ncbi:hypothetical protein [Leptothoe sp. PORK10 BA2]|uniref:GspE/PulE/PilB domain-containing protein n=1 Tax=Leptothoe sp. PORK10 BA2 TaxID=3110254 RepID=UPI002B1FFD48|nr:hypothetical protein [Leptothoe sp. PORK10 BA2]MEA5463488.1 hypothetical protein [Leptothoe sp. PORK10 BA2]
MSIFPEDKALSPPLPGPQKTEVKADLDQMFLLIEGILPFEACLYYQVLPLSIEGSSLNLGMVNPDDNSASDYVRRLVSYINCSIVSRPIASDWHREILSKFLSHSAKSRQPSQPSQPQTVSNSKAFEELPTLVVESPTEIIEAPHRAITQPPKTPIPEKFESPAPSTPPSHQDAQQSPQRPVAAIQAAEPPVVPLAAPLTIELKDEASDPDGDTADEKPSTSSSETGFRPSQTTPKELTQVLLKRIITQEGIGRLYLERQNATCRILWSKDGVVQSVVDDVSPQLFQGVINELKRMMSLSLIPVRKPKQIEIERIHNQKRILLRFRVTPGEHGEAATLQILRGAALKFYQQQQIDNISRDALGIAHDLQQRIDELRTQAQRNLDTQDTKQKTLPAIMNMLKQMEQQLHDIIDEPD